MSESVSLPAAAALPSGRAALVKRYWPVALIALLVLWGGHAWFRHAFDDLGYAPQQPIAFSHKQHAGDLKLDCRFCHFNAERGKHAGVPPMSVCMSCHGAVGTDKPGAIKLAEIASTGSYSDADGSLKEGGVVHWARVHRLPDHVFFSHASHVAAGVACQTCHGPVETMTVLRQTSTLTMQECLDCHRKTNYVGGPGSDPKDRSTWTVGTPDYTAQQAREVADPLVVFHERRVKGGKPDAPAEPTPAAPDRMAAFLAKHPEFAAKVKHLPAWRAATLPASHLMNAATNCSTCHQ